MKKPIWKRAGSGNSRGSSAVSAISGLIDTAAPFVIALALAWAVLQVWKRPTDWRIGVGVCAIVVVAGMLLRNLVFDGGTATSFVIVATLFLGLFLVGWRLVFGLIAQRPVRSTLSARSRSR